MKVAMFFLNFNLMLIVALLAGTPASRASVIGMLSAYPGNNVTVKYVIRNGAPALRVDLQKHWNCPVHLYRHSPEETFNRMAEKIANGEKHAAATGVKPTLVTSHEDFNWMPIDLQELETPTAVDKIRLGIWEDRECMETLPRKAAREARTLFLDLKTEVFGTPAMRPHYEKFARGDLQLYLEVQVPAGGYEDDQQTFGPVKVGTTADGEILLQTKYATPHPTVTDLGLTSLRKIRDDLSVYEQPAGIDGNVLKRHMVLVRGRELRFPASKAAERWSFERERLTVYVFALHEGELIDQAKRLELARTDRSFCEINVSVRQVSDALNEIKIPPFEFENSGGSSGGCAFCGREFEASHPDIYNKRYFKSSLPLVNVPGQNEGGQTLAISCTMLPGEKLTYAVLDRHLKSGGKPWLTTLTDYPSFQDGFRGKHEHRQLDLSTLATGLSRSLLPMAAATKLADISIYPDVRWKPERTYSAEQAEFVLRKGDVAQMETDYADPDDMAPYVKDDPLSANKLVSHIRMYTFLKEGKAVSQKQAMEEVDSGTADFCILHFAQSINVNTREANRNSDEAALAASVVLPKMTQYIRLGTVNQSAAGALLAGKAALSTLDFDSREMDRQFEEPYVVLYDVSCLNSKKKDLTLADVQKHLPFLSRFQTDVITQQQK